MDFEERTELLLPTEKLHKSCVAVFGLGGVGSYTAESLVRLGIGTLILVDADVIQVSNINRQLPALHSTIGRKKIDAMRERFFDISPELHLYTYDIFLNKENTADFLSSLPVRPDFMADCIDTVSAKLEIISYGREHDIPVISCMGTGNKLHPELLRIDDIFHTSVCPLCRVMRKELRARNIPSLQVVYSSEPPIQTKDATTIGSVSYVPSVAGLLITSEISRQLLA